MYVFIYLFIYLSICLSINHNVIISNLWSVRPERVKNVILKNDNDKESELVKNVLNIGFIVRTFQEY